MGIVRGILVFIEIVVGVLLIGVILVQKSRDEGLGLAFGSGMGEALFGSRAGNVLTRITITLAVVFMINTIFLTVLSSRVREDSLTSRLPGAAAPVQGTGSGSGPAAPAVPESPLSGPGPVEGLAPIAAPPGDAGALSPVPPAQPVLEDPAVAPAPAGAGGTP